MGKDGPLLTCMEVEVVGAVGMDVVPGRLVTVKAGFRASCGRRERHGSHQPRRAIQALGAASPSQTMPPTACCQHGELSQGNREELLAQTSGKLERALRKLWMRARGPRGPLRALPTTHQGTKQPFHSPGVPKMLRREWPLFGTQQAKAALAGTNIKAQSLLSGTHSTALKAGSTGPRTSRELL